MGLLRALGALVGLAGVARAHHIVVVDCGSTGSRSHLFEYPERVQIANTSALRRNIVSGSPVSYPTMVAHFKVSPGISSFADNPGDVAKGLKTIIDLTVEAVRKRKPNADLGGIPIYLGATAGMRVLTDEVRDAIMLAVREFLGGPDCPFDFPRPEQARVLSGEEEGAFGWLAANKKMGTLTSDAAVAYGALDMGGASAQISFLPIETSVLAHMFPIHIGNFKTGPIHLYTHSYLKFGYSIAFRTSGLFASFGSSTFTHPCLPRGLVWHVDEKVFGVATDSGAPEREHGPVTMSGGGNFYQCRTLARSLMVQTYCTTEPCSLLGVYLPTHSKNTFLAFSEFKSNFDRMNITADTVAPPLEALAARLVSWCSMSLEEQAAISKEKIGTWKAKLELSCWLGTWILEFLTTGLGFPEDTRQISLVGSDFDIGWAEGQAIYEASYFPYKLVEPARERRTELGSALAGAPVEAVPTALRAEQPPPPPWSPLLASLCAAVALGGVFAGRLLERHLGQRGPRGRPSWALLG